MKGRKDKFLETAMTARNESFKGCRLYPQLRAMLVLPEEGQNQSQRYPVTCSAVLRGPTLLAMWEGLKRNRRA